MSLRWVRSPTQVRPSASITKPADTKTSNAELPTPARPLPLPNLMHGVPQRCLLWPSPRISRRRPRQTARRRSTSARRLCLLRPPHGSAWRRGADGTGSRCSMRSWCAHSRTATASVTSRACGRGWTTLPGSASTCLWLPPVLPLCRLRYGGYAKPMGIRDLPGQQGRPPRLHPAQRLPSRHCRRSTGLRLRPLPGRPHSLDGPLTPDELTAQTTKPPAGC